jgi:hypothetical protein
MSRHSYTRFLAVGLAVIVMSAPFERSLKAAEGSPVSQGDTGKGLKAQTGAGSPDILELLPTFLTSDKRKQFAAELEAAIRKGDMELAERQINDAVELGTFSIILMTSIRDPKLLTALQELNLTDAGASAKPDTILNGNPAKQTATGIIAAPDMSELQAALDWERVQGEATRRELAAAMEGLRDYTSRNESASAALVNMQEALGQEREFAETSRREVETLNDSLHKLHAMRQQEQTSAQIKITELQDAIEQQRVRTVSEYAQLQQVLNQEKEHNSRIAHELAVMRDNTRGLRALQVSSESSAQSTISDLQTTVERERARTEIASRELAEAGKEIQLLFASREADASANASRVAQLQEALGQEQERVATLTRDMTATKESLREFQALQKNSEASAQSKILELTSALEREATRNDEVARDFANAADANNRHQVLQEHTPALALFRLDVSGTENFVRPIPGYGFLATAQYAMTAIAATSPFGEEATMQEDGMRLAPADFGVAASISPLSGNSVLHNPSHRHIDAQVASVPPLPLPERGAIGTRSGSQVSDRLVARAERLIQSGDISGARLLLERALQTGTPRAAFLLAETFDPHALSRLGVRGMRGDAQKARESYAHALALGVGEAAERIEALK